MRCWTDPQRTCEWWGTAAELDPRPGGACRVERGGGPVMRGEYVELVPHERIVFSFGWEPTDGAPSIAPGSTRRRGRPGRGERRHDHDAATHRHTDRARRRASIRLGALSPAARRRRDPGLDMTVDVVTDIVEDLRGAPDPFALAVELLARGVELLETWTEREEVATT